VSILIILGDKHKNCKIIFQKSYVNRMYEFLRIYFATLSLTGPLIHPRPYSPLLGPSLLFSFVIFFTDGKTPWPSDQPVARPLPTHRRTQPQNKRTQTPMPRMGFEPTIPAFQWTERVHVSERAATVTS
jgi:hypothetical protein